MKVTIIRMPFGLALDVAKHLHELAKHIDTAPPGTRLQELATSTHNLAEQMREAMLSGAASVTEGRRTRAGELYVERVKQADWSGS